MSSEGLTGRDLRSAILFGAAVYLGVRFISQIADVLLVFIVSALITLALNPAVSWLERHKIPRAVSAGTLALCVIGAVVVVLYLVIPPAGAQLVDLGNQVPELANRAEDWADKFADKHPSIAQYIPTKLNLDKKTLSDIGKPLLGGVSRATASAAGAVATMFIAFITTIYMLANPKPLMDGFLRGLDPATRRKAKAAGTRLNSQIRAWVRGILIAMLSIFIFTWVGLSIVGIKQAFLFAVIAGLLEAVPMVGPVVAGIPPTIVGLMSGHPIQGLYVLITFVVIQQFDGNVLMPFIMSRQLSLHPVTALFMVLVLGGLFGLVGVFLAAPVAVTIGILYDEFYIRGRRAASANDG